MFKTVLKFLKKKYYSTIRSIAFYPVLISLAFLLLAILTIKLESIEVINSIKQKIPYLFIENYETARAILATFIGGIISITVFSYTMVMSVLNQASSNFSPRLLPNLISDKKNQFILGFYVGTLLYCIIIIIALGAYGVDEHSVGLSTMIAAMASLACIGIFVYFINSISVAIQIHNIIDSVYTSASRSLDYKLENQRKNKVVVTSINSDDWAIVNIDKTGYFTGFDISLMSDSIKNKGNHIEIIPYANSYVWKGTPILKIKENLSDKELDNLVFCCEISSDRHVGDSDLTGMIQLMEIAVRAMSPGINDPGTAIDAINKLGLLLSKFLQFSKLVSKPAANNNLMITEHTISAQELMRTLIQPIRLYSKQDNSVLNVLIKSLYFVKSNPYISKENKDIVDKELHALKYDINKNIDNDYDKEYLIKLIENSKSEII